VFISGGLKSFILEVLILLELRQCPFPSAEFKQALRKADPSRDFVDAQKLLIRQSEWRMTFARRSGPRDDSVRAAVPDEREHDRPAR